IPEDAGVANAVGAVAGRVEAKADATILSPDGDRYDLITDGAPQVFVEEAAARDAAEAWARDTARARAAAAGADDIELRVEWSERRASVEAREILVEAKLTVAASGRPRFRD
ncbi:MAG: hydantoinase/oxoprolinase family protein, partial [Pseudomonadota bacterium]